MRRKAINVTHLFKKEIEDVKGWITIEHEWRQSKDRKEDKVTFKEYLIMHYSPPKKIH